MQTYPQKRIMKCFFVIIFLFILGISLTIPFQNTDRQSYKLDNTNPISKNNFQFNQLPHINVTLFSELNNNSNHLEIVGNASDPSTSAELALKVPSPPTFDQWLGYNSSVNIYNLLDNRTWGKGNADFSNGTDLGDPMVNQSDNTTVFHADEITDWEINYFEDSDENISNDMTIEYDEASNYVNMTYYGYKTGPSTYKYSGGEFLELNQTGFDVPRGAIKRAWIKVIYNPIHVKAGPGEYFDFSVKINGEDVFVKKNPDLSPGLVDTGWISTVAWDNTTSVFPAPSGNGYTDFNISLKFKIRIDIGNTLSMGGGGFNDYQRIQIYGFYLALEAMAQPNSTDIQLKVNNHTINGTFGAGYTQWSNIYPNFVSNNPYKLIFNSSSVNDQLDLSFDVDVKFNALNFLGTTLTRSKNDLGVYYDIDLLNSKIKYQFYLYAYWDFTTFSNFYFNFSLPIDWNITLVRNPSLANVYNKTANYNLGIIGGNSSDGFVLIPAKNSTGGTLAEIPGWWYFEAEAPNYLTDIELFKKEGSSWVPSTEFNSSGYFDGDQIKVKATLSNETGVPPGITSSAAHLNLIMPNGSLLIYQYNDSIDSATGEVNFGPFILAGMNTTGGEFSAQVYWNGTYDYLNDFEKIMTSGSFSFGAGYSQKNFTLFHDAEIGIVNPLDAQIDLEAYVNYFDIVPLKILLNNTDGNTLISGASVQVNWTSIIALTEISEGLYSTSLDTTDLGNPGAYYLVINSSKAGYTNSSTTLKLNVFAESILNTIISPIPAGLESNFSFIMFYHLPSDPTFNFSSGHIDVSTLPTSDYLAENTDYIYSDLGDGLYNITIFTGPVKKVNQTGNTNLYFHASKGYVENATRTDSLFINPPETELLTNTTFFDIPKYESINFTIKYQTKLDKFPLNNASINLLGYSNYSVTPISQGLYEITLEYGNQTKSYPITITANKDGYAIASTDVVLIVRGLDQFTQNSISQRASIITVGESTEFVLTVNYTYTGVLLTDANITMNYEWAHGSGNLEIRGINQFVLVINNTANIPPGTYQISIKIYDQDNCLVTEELIELTLSAIPLPPWIYSVIGAVIITIIILLALTYYFKYQKPKGIFKNKKLMTKYDRYLDAHNVQHMLIIQKGAGIRIMSKTYKTETEIDDDLIAGFLQAIITFGAELSGVETAVMENITYKGSKILLENGDYVITCLLLKENESESLRQKIKSATVEFEKRYSAQLKDFVGRVDKFENALDIFDKSLEIYLTKTFKLDYMRHAKQSKTFNKNQKLIMEEIAEKIELENITLQGIFSLLKESKITLQDPEIFAELYDLIEKGVIIPSSTTKNLKNSKASN